MKNSTCCPLDNKPATYLLEESGYSYFRCDACGLRFIWPLPDLEVILSIYGEGYRQIPPVPATQANLRAGAQEKRKRFLGDLPDGFAPGDHSLLDIGCGLSFMLEALRQDFRRVRGLELSEPQRTYAQETLGLDVVDGEASVIPLGDECENVVVLWHVLEHLLDPPASLREVHRVLKPGGLLFIATPNPESLTARLIGKRWIHYNAPNHLHLFPPRTLVKFVEQAAFEVLTLRTDTPLLHHLSEVCRRSESRCAAMKRSTIRVQRIIGRSRLLKATVESINALLAHWLVGDNLRLTARKNT